MTVGEKIQHYRKQIGISQEALGEKLFVSRQTVSLWEMDKTLPTIDNLIRLKEIFSISIDELLSDTNPAQDNKVSPKESYIFRYHSEELQEIFKKSSSPMIKTMVIFAVIFIWALIAMISEGVDAGWFVVISVMFLIVAASSISQFVSHKRSWNRSIGSIVASTYSYEVFDDYFILNVFREEELVRMLKFRFDEVEKSHDWGKYIALIIANQLYILRKTDLAPDSKLLEQSKSISTTKQPAEKASGKLKLTSNLLSIFSVLSIIGALICVAFTTETKKNFAGENLWIFYLFTIIPACSILFAFYLKKKGYKHKSNLIIGIVMAALLCIYGSFPILIGTKYSHDDGLIVQMEQLLEIDIPQHYQINTEDATNSNKPDTAGAIQRTTYIYFNDDAVIQFEKDISNNSKWLDALPSDIVGISSYYCHAVSTKDNLYCMVFNKDTGEFNSLPAENGLYSFVNVIYDADQNSMTIVEYCTEYIE